MDRDTLQLLDGFAHDLRTPLSAIAGHSSLLTLGVHGPLSEAQAHALDRIEINKTQLIEMISNFLSYAEAASGALTQLMEECALRPLVAQCVSALEDAACAEGVRLIWPDSDDTSEVTDAYANASSPDLALINTSTTREVISIMLEDAIAHSEPGSLVHVGVQCADDLLCVKVESTVRATVDDADELLFVPYARDAHGRPVYAPGLPLSLPRARALARGMGADVHAVFANSRRVLRFDVARCTKPCDQTGET